MPSSSHSFVALGPQLMNFRYLGLSEPCCSLQLLLQTKLHQLEKDPTGTQLPFIAEAPQLWTGFLFCPSPAAVQMHSAGPSTSGTFQGWLSPACADAQSRVLSLPALDPTEWSDRGTVTFLTPFTCGAKIHCRLRRPETLPMF